MQHKEEILLFLLFIQFALQSLAVISLENGGYKNIVVAIHKDVPEDEKLLTNLKELFTKASSYLNTTTNGQAYFKEIIIAIPSTWENKPQYEDVLKNYFPSADVRIDHPNPYHENDPYTLQPGGCGEHGQYIHITPHFVKELHGETADNYGPAERHIVHEWAHLRYGVFDEYGLPGDPNYPAFYLENGKIVPTSCIHRITGWIEALDGGPCSITADGTVSEDCRFIPNVQNEDAKASVMYLPYIPSITGFCDHTAERLHNARAPTKHNTLCWNQPTWTVITNHPDFSKRAKRATFITTKPIFRLVRAQKGTAGRYVLVLDVSGSMGGEPIKLLHRAARRFIEDRVPDGDQLGIVSFGSKADVLHNLTRISNTTRSQLSKALPTKDSGGSTAIGQGLIQAVKVLKSQGELAEGGLIILITDGEENVKPLIHKILPMLEKEKVVVNAIAFGSKASAKLEPLTKATGGKGFFFADIKGKQQTNALDSAFLDSVTSQADLEFQPVQILDGTIKLNSSITFKKIDLDKELGKNTVFTFTSKNIENVDIILKSPSGQVFNSSSSEYTKDALHKLRIAIKLSESETGRWTAIIRRSGSTDVAVSVSVISEPKDPRIQPVRVRSWLSNVQLKYPAHAKVYAEVKKGYDAVIGAKVKAMIDRPLGPPVEVFLKDNGAGPDGSENDGIYSGFFTQFNGNGRYAVVANVLNDGDAKLKIGSKASAALAATKFKNLKDREKKNATSTFQTSEFVLTNKTKKPTEPEGEPADVFERVSNAGAFRLDDFKANDEDIIPPSRVFDLKVLSSNELANKKFVTLKWTSPGDDVDVGNATSIDLRASVIAEDLLERFTALESFNKTSVVDGNFTPAPPGEMQVLSVEVPNTVWQKNSNNSAEHIDVYFALRIIDDNNNKGNVSNIASGHFGKLEFASSPIFMVKAAEKINWLPYIIGIGVASLIAIILIFILTVVYCKRRKTYKPET
ncbi:epithelial chloride channel protein-like [Limulus polyphemus]|uniref:Epithelial chloride channel protein-like n=1 Tax=Limulus polyphemus TaxID=6850 RepID=A0ABM1SE51_LIMPO|nr:epithelial chloride channel protein-like [Limulus polyphemus]XP_022241906.1 epithelial chloride channel protein-like [Limulus polyphemus]XP_022241907.1 epithelial chloride channel protein-like [Limulus polyphemus]